MPKRKRAPSPKFDLLEDGFDDDLSSNDDKPGTPIQRNAANARERARMRVLSKAFFNLKRNIPWVPADTKLSKLDTLRLAKNYINYLAATLNGQSVEDFSSNLAQPPKTAWPFIFQQVQPHPEPSKSKQQQQQASFGPSTTPPAPNAANVGQISSAADQKWSEYAKDAGTCRDPSTGGVGGSEDIESQSVSPPNRLHHRPVAATGSTMVRQFSESQSVSSSGMEGVNEYDGGFGEPMVVCTAPQPQHQLQRQQVLHQQHHQSHHLHQQHQQQAHEHSMVQHHHHHHHHQQLHQQYAAGNSMTGGQSHNGGCHIGNGIPASYQRQQHMTSIVGD
ncbi:basic helix-loop-helix neural transcription factor TAP-like [Anopheles albimanus]|uniref:BHLH domain-containing protein n=1 Tax=Anopheles albimanus TaxID=7167 RepID=A0A182FMR0_ANOAL|nr:basic helix-loop-helix neural transcription factor TAP-like [Anopheles albimanus]